MDSKRIKLSIVIPCYNEEKTLAPCVARVLDIQDDSTALEIVIVDDCSTDNSFAIAGALENEHQEVRVLRTPRTRARERRFGAVLKA